jgi:hypothetical protein
MPHHSQFVLHFPHVKVDAFRWWLSCTLDLYTAGLVVSNFICNFLVYFDLNCYFLGSFAELRKATVTFVMSVCLCVRMDQLASHWTNLHVIWYFIIFCRQNFRFIKMWQKWRALYMKTNIHFCSYLTQFLGLEMSPTKVVVEVKTHIFCSITFFPKMVPFKRQRRKLWYSRTGQRWHNMAHALRVLDN